MPPLSYESVKSYTLTSSSRTVDVALLMDEHFFLQWEDFHGNLKSSYTELRENNQFSDVTLCCEGGQQVKAHKIILSATSSLLNDILIQNDHPNPLIYLRGIHIEQLNFLVDFMYHGEVQVPTSTLQEFMAMAEDFKIKGLTGQKGIHEDASMNSDKSQEYSVSENQARKTCLLLVKLHVT